MATIARDPMKSLRGEIQAALKAVAQKHGVTVEATIVLQRGSEEPSHAFSFDSRESPKLTPKDEILSIAPKAKSVRDWNAGGYRIDFGQEVLTARGERITTLQTEATNHVDAWNLALYHLLQE